MLCVRYFLLQSYDYFSNCTFCFCDSGPEDDYHRNRETDEYSSSEGWWSNKLYACEIFAALHVAADGYF